MHAIGDRVYLIDMIGLLKKKKKELETSATLWSGETPATGFGELLNVSLALIFLLVLSNS